MALDEIFALVGHAVLHAMPPPSCNAIHRAIGDRLGVVEEPVEARERNVGLTRRKSSARGSSS
jgi:hypothetical protein